MAGALSFYTNDNPSPIVGKVCKSVVYIPHRFDKTKDLNLLKVTNIHEDGTRSDQLVGIEDYVRDFWIVREKYRKFKDNKDYIDKRLCERRRSTQANLASNIKKALFGVPDRSAKLMDVLNNQYVFGCQATPVLIKHSFFVKYGEYQEKEAYTMAAYDVETDMLNGEGENITMASTTFKKKIIFAAVRDIFPQGWSDKKILAELKFFENKLLRERLDRRGAVVEYVLVDNQSQVVKTNVEKWHEWHPDWIASWNSNYDMKANEHALRSYNEDPADVYSDPSIPKQYKHYYYYEGRTHKRKENGDTQPLEWQEQFPTLQGASSWQWVDAASFYAIKRAAGGKKDSYGLQFTAEDNEIDGKLYTDAGSHLPPGTPDWHRYMQEHHIFEYCMYNIVDNIVIEELDEKNNDLSLSLPMLLKSSEFYNYPSQPKCISDELSFIAFDEGYVWGTRGRSNEDEFEVYKQDLSDWIALLETEKIEELGKHIFKGMTSVRSRGRGLTDDIDVEGAYPTGTVALNVSNKTTRMEACKIEGADRIKFREIGVNYASSPAANAISLCQDLHGFPDLTGALKKYDELVGQ